MRSAARAAGRPVELEVHLVNTDATPLGACFLRSIDIETDRTQPGFAIHKHFDESTARRASAWKRRWRVGEDYGYVATDLGLLDLRRRKGCDYYHFTNGDNVYHVDYFFLQLSEYEAMKSTVLTGVDFYSHLVAEDRARRGQPYESSVGHLRVKAIDLAAMLFKAQYLDRKNLTFIVRRYERGKRLAAGRRRPGNRPQGAGSMMAADGALAELIARKVGKGRAREIHGHGPLVFHL